MFKKTLAILIAIITIVSCTACQSMGVTLGTVIDLSILSADDAYAGICEIMINPYDYEDKDMIMKGELYTYESESGEDCVAVIIKDEDGCCSKGIQFVLSDKYSSAIDNLVDGDEIIVTGTFELYSENELLYCKLADAELEATAKGM